MWGYSLPSIIRLKSVILYLSGSKAHRTIWAIGASAVFVTVVLASLHPDKADAPYGKAQSVDIHRSSTDNVATPNQSSIIETAITTSPQPDQSRSSSNVRINDQVIPLPSNGSIHKTIQSDDGQTKLDVTIDSSSTSGQSNSSTNIQLNMNSDQETTIENSE